MNTTQRATGRTYRFALQACLKASLGGEVLWVCGNQQERQSAQRMIEDLSCGFQLKGKIDFRLMSENFTGQSRTMKYDLVIEDELLGQNWRAISCYLETKAKMNGFLRLGSDGT